MKTIQKTISKSKYVLLALLVVFSVSCSTEDGEPGPQGPAGTDGTDGTDGNANVQAFTFDLSSESGINVSLPVPGLTAQMAEENVILVSYKTADGTIYMAPGPGLGSTFATKVYFDTFDDVLKLGFRNYDGTFYSISAGDILSARVFTIEPSSTTSGRTIQGKQQIYNELTQAGVDINNYHAVCDYYGIAY